MKTFLLFLCTVLWAISLQAQDTTIERIKNNFLKVNIVSPIDNIFALGYERKINPIISWQISTFGIIESQNRNDFNSKTNAFGITPEIRFYVSEEENAPKGVFLAPFITYMYFDSKTELPIQDIDLSVIDFRRSEVKSHTFGFGMVLGYQFFLKNRVTIDGWIGPGFYLSNLQSKNYNTSSNLGNGLPYFVNQGGDFGTRTGITVGFAF
jgi:Protein of unknown function (DUF3575)